MAVHARLSPDLSVARGKVWCVARAVPPEGRLWQRRAAAARHDSSECCRRQSHSRQHLAVPAAARGGPRRALSHRSHGDLATKDTKNTKVLGAFLVIFGSFVAENS